MYTFLIIGTIKNIQGAGREMVQWVKTLIPKPDPLCSISRIHLIEKTDSFMLFSDLGRHIVACVLS